METEQGSLGTKSEPRHVSKCENLFCKVEGGETVVNKPVPVVRKTTDDPDVSMCQRRGYLECRFCFSLLHVTSV